MKKVDLHEKLSGPTIFLQLFCSLIKSTTPLINIGRGRMIFD